MRILFPLTILALAAAPALSADQPSDADRLAKAIAGLAPDTPTDCIDRRSAGAMTVIGSDIVFRSSKRLTYVNRATPGCRQRFGGEGLIFRSPSIQMCRGDIAEVRDFTTGMTTGSCALGDFVPYRAQ